jgi:hypothetical protein
MNSQINFTAKTKTDGAFFTCPEPKLQAFIKYLESQKIGILGNEQAYEVDGIAYFSIILRDNFSEDAGDKLICTFKG